MSRDSLLVELLVEELPPKALKRLGETFASALAHSLQNQGLAARDVIVTPYASPRRLAVHLSAVAKKAPDQAVSHKLVPVSVGWDAHGQPTPALLKKLAGLGLGSDGLPALARRVDGKNESFFYDTVAPGASLQEGLQKALDQALAALPIPKMMAYQLADGWTTVRFVRPAHALLALHGSDVVPVYALGLTAGRSTQGHRFESLARTLDIEHADSYAAQLEAQGAVLPSFAARRAEIERLLAAAAASIGGVKPVQDDDLLDEVTALVERPNVLVGQFDADFLQVPQECLILTMKANQKYFPLLDQAGRLTHRFLIVSNIRPADPSAVVQGNERVVRPRLADAKFFFDQDRRKPLAERLPGLAKVVYHHQLGSQGERSERVTRLALAIYGRLLSRVIDGEDAGIAVRMEDVQTAARMAKADLLTDMVGEFPELQGVMGAYYARHDGLSETVAQAIEDHYKPRFAGDALPRNLAGTVVALADKLETLVGLFGIGQLPSGDKDPFALRRHALGVVRMLMERDLPLELDDLLQDASAAFGEKITDTRFAVADFIYERLAGSLREQGYSAQEVDAVLFLRPQRLGDVVRRLKAVQAFAALPEAESLAAANKRVGNILKKAGSADAMNTLNAVLLREPAEQALHQALQTAIPAANAAFEQGDYTGSLQALARLRAPVDAFFDGVMVNVDDPALRANRLALLAALHTAMNRVADLGRLAS